MAATTGLSQGDFTRLRVADQTGDLVDILTLLGNAGGIGGDITTVTGSAQSQSPRTEAIERYLLICPPMQQQCL